MESEIFKSLISYTISIQNIPDSRLPKICYNILKNYVIKYPNTVTYNWYLQAQVTFDKYNAIEILNTGFSTFLAAEKQHLLDYHEHLLLNSDYFNLTQSHSLVILLFKPLTIGPQPYLSARLTNSLTCLLTETRPSNIYKPSIIHNGIHRFNSVSKCGICNLHAPDDLYHFLIECPMLSDLRRNLLGQRAFESEFWLFCLAFV